MATSQAAPAATAAVCGGGAAGTTGETIVGVHVFKIDNFSATKNLGVGKSIKSSVFRVGGHAWYIECYPCGDVEENAGQVTLCICRQHEDDDHPAGSRVSGHCEFTLMKSVKDGCYKKLIDTCWTITFTDQDRHSVPDTNFMKRKKLESLLKDDLLDCFHVRCVVFIEKLPTTPPPDQTVAGSHLLTVEDSYSKIWKAFVIGDCDCIESRDFHVGGHTWCLWFYPWGDDYVGDGDIDAVDPRVTSDLILSENPDDNNNEVKVRLAVTLLTHAGLIISSTQDFFTFSSERRDRYNCNFLTMMEHESSPLLQDGIKIRCDIAVVNEITAVPNLCRGIGGDGQQVRGDVTFEVGGHLFAAHKFVLATRCTAFMAKFFGQAGNENTDVTKQPVHIDDMEPRVFEALLHFIYTDALPVVDEKEKVAMAQGLLVAADRYAMERLKLICGDLLCSCIKDARTAVTTLDLADKCGCRRLKEACMKFLMEFHCGKVADS